MLDIENHYRAIGNTLIKLGALLPGIGGGMVEALYIGNLSESSLSGWATIVV